MKKVLMCARMPHDDSYIGGVVSIVLSYLKHEELFMKQGYKVEVYSYEPGKQFKKLPEKIQNALYVLPQKRELIKKINSDMNISILHIHTSREFLFLKDVYLAREIKKAKNIKVSLTVHVGDIGTVFNRISAFKRLIVRWINKYVDKVFFLSTKIQKQFIDVGIETEKTEVLYNFFDFNPKHSDEADSKRNDVLKLLFLGAIHRDKGIIELLTALNQSDEIDYHLTVCGKITDRGIEKQFLKLVDNLGNKVSMLGYVSGDLKEKVFRESDVLVLPSYHEGMPLVILEALGAGLGIISTRVGATPEILGNENVLWVEIGDITSLKEKIMLLAKDNKYLEKMKTENYALSKQYTIEEHIKHLCSQYNIL